MALHDIVSPLPGTFYRRPSPDADYYVSVGATVAAGAVVGLVEVMKQFTEIEADAAGRVVELLVEDGHASAKAKARGAGRIVNIASLAGQNGGSATGAHYAAAKGGTLTLTKVFARDLAAQGVTVNAISPGPLDLPIVYESVAPEKLRQVLASLPGGKLGSAAFVADAAVLLASGDAHFANGACWDINGGLYMR
jgi:NAD(P)-dependent dehydrogenase (short-subunit alcohol dehydrogenase family)